MAEVTEKGGPDAKLMKEARDRYNLASDAWADNRSNWLEDVRFLEPGGMWPANIRKERTLDQRPCLEMDKISQHVRQVVNDGRQNRPAVKVRPVDGMGDIKVAGAFQGHIRSICDRSRADQAFDTALDHAAKGGFGYFRVLLDYEHEKTFNQEIVVKRVRNPLNVLLDPNAQEADGSDACWGFVTEDIPQDQFKLKYPSAKFTNWESDRGEYAEGWLSEKNVRVCEYWYKVQEPRNLLLLEDGTSVTEEEYWSANTMVETRPKIVESRNIPINKVKWCRMTGAEVLEKRDWLGKYIPIIPVYGNESDVDGRLSYSGLVRKAKDPQMLYNFSRSAFAERVALAPKSPFVAADGQVEDYEDDWRDANKKNIPVLKYKPISVDDKLVPAPQRQPAADVPAGFAQDMQHSEHDIQASMGMYSASLGEKSNEKSGKAIMARQREGDTATFHYQDNLNRAICYLGRILVDLIPKVINSKRSIRLLGEDGQPSMATVDPNLKSMDGKPMASDKVGAETIYNLGVGVYDVTVTAGPSYTTKRQEAAEAMMQLTQSAPELMKVIGDLMIRNMDWPGADEIADRLKKMLPPELQDEGDEENPEVAAVRAQAQQMIDQLKAQFEDAEAFIAQLQQQNQTLEQQLKNKASEAEAKLQDADTRSYEARTERMQALAPAITPELIAQIVQSTVREIMAQPAPGGSGMPPEPPPIVDAPIDEPPPGGFFTP